jgi:hypothetical protein
VTPVVLTISYTLRTRRARVEAESYRNVEGLVIGEPLGVIYGYVHYDTMRASITFSEHVSVEPRETETGVELVVVPERRGRRRVRGELAPLQLWLMWEPGTLVDLATARRVGEITSGVSNVRFYAGFTELFYDEYTKLREYRDVLRFKLVDIDLGVNSRVEPNLLYLIPPYPLKFTTRKAGSALSIEMYSL